MPRKKKRKTFVLGKDFRSDGKERVTKSRDFLVHGGTEITHEETVGIVNEFSKRLKKEGYPDANTASEILREVLHDQRKRN